MHDVSHLLGPGESLEWMGAPAEHLHRHLGADLRYLITNRRILIADETGTDSFTPDALSKLELRPADDGTSDVVWDVVEQMQDRRHRTGLIVRLRSLRRDDRVGFIGVPDGDAVMQRLEAWLAARSAEAAADADTAWAWHREPATGFAIRLPASWQLRFGTTKEYKILGIRIQRPPQLTTRADVPWNTLEATVPGMAIAVGVMLNPDEMPESLDAVLNSRLASMLNVRVVSSETAVRIGALEGFGVVQNLQGAAGGSVQLGPITVSAGGFKDKLLQQQVWLRSAVGNVHVQAVTPAEADAVRAVIDRSVASMRFGEVAAST
ncbi:MAG TPA: hypothetical protein PK788_08305 [Gemmatimonadaceae bacterium]|nr:hypothetical protein [Gemmatimonadaceae bacterium]HRQ77156.1 hypothetical protein [Gemmatimonadaceae bacterium]